MNASELYAPDVEMESVGSHHGRSNKYDPGDMEREDLRRPTVATTEAAPSGEFTRKESCVSDRGSDGIFRKRKG